MQHAKTITAGRLFRGCLPQCCQRHDLCPPFTRSSALPTSPAPLFRRTTPHHARAPRRCSFHYSTPGARRAPVTRCSTQAATMTITFVRTFSGSDASMIPIPYDTPHTQSTASACTQERREKKNCVASRAEPRGTVQHCTVFEADLDSIQSNPIPSRVSLELCGKRKRERGGALHILLQASCGTAHARVLEYAADGSSPPKCLWQCQPRFLAPLCLLKSLVCVWPAASAARCQTYLICDAAPATSHPLFPRIPGRATSFTYLPRTVLTPRSPS